MTSPSSATRPSSPRGPSRAGRSWNDRAPELGFCELAANLVETLRPRVVLETGTGEGFLTRRLAGALGPGQTLVSFEADETLRGSLASLPFFAAEAHRLSPAPNPNEVEFGRADLTVLDSDFAHRADEVERWWRSAAAGSVLLVHDTGNGHPADSPQAALGERIRSLGIPGVFLRNPRGGFLGIKPGGGRPTPAGEAPLAS